MTQMKKAKCYNCGKTIAFLKSNNKWMPIDVSGNRHVCDRSLLKTKVWKGNDQSIKQINQPPLIEIIFPNLP